MWRNYDEDWERRKTYLIRSLFQDIPLLSPVVEEQESRYSADSTSNIPHSRPHSPLPPLIIERVPNRHDHPKQFYTELEQKMKKLYRKLFYNARSSSVDDLLETYGGEYEFVSSVHHNEEYSANNEEFEDQAESLTEIDNQYHYQGLSPNKVTSETFSQEFEIIDHARQIHTSFTKGSSCAEQQSQDQSSTQTLCATQITIVADVHAPISRSAHTQESSENSSDEDATLLLSPILQKRQLVAETNIMNFCQNNDKSIQSTRDSENFASTESNSETEKVKNSDTSHEDTISEEQILEQLENASQKSDASIELMRRQEDISPSLESLPRPPIQLDNSGLSLTYTDIDFQNKLSLERGDKGVSAENEMLHIRQSSIQEAPDDFTVTSTSSSYETHFERFLREARKHRRISSSDDESQDQPISKRRRYQNIAVQTFIDDYRQNKIVEWNQLKANFFVGEPSIYKLCSCNDHSCDKSK